jgi:hypothetical protein
MALPGSEQRHASLTERSALPMADGEHLRKLSPRRKPFFRTTGLLGTVTPRAPRIA